MKSIRSPVGLNLRCDSRGAMALKREVPEEKVQAVANGSAENISVVDENDDDEVTDAVCPDTSCSLSDNEDCQSNYEWESDCTENESPQGQVSLYIVLAPARRRRMLISPAHFCFHGSLKLYLSSTTVFCCIMSTASIVDLLIRTLRGGGVVL